MATTRYTVIEGEILSENRAGVKRDYVPDPLGSTLALLDNTQTQTDTFSYYPYGEVASRTGTTATPFQYIGTLGYYQDNSGRTYVRARHLRTAHGRWMTQDPIGFDGGDVNLYRYVASNPSSDIDPSGLEPVMWGCVPEERRRINQQVQDICNYRINKLPHPQLRKCLKRRCSNIKIVCHDIGAEGPCSDGGAGTTEVIGMPYTDTINLCRPDAFHKPHIYGCLGKVILHEMIHSCNGIGCPIGDSGPIDPSTRLHVGPGSVHGMTLVAYGPGTTPCPTLKGRKRM